MRSGAARSSSPPATRPTAPTVPSSSGGSAPFSPPTRATKRRIVKVSGFVNATPEFIEHTKVINGASDLLVEVFGEAGRHARLAVACPSLPWNIALEVEVVAEIAG